MSGGHHDIVTPKHGCHQIQIWPRCVRARAGVRIRVLPEGFEVRLPSYRSEARQDRARRRTRLSSLSRETKKSCDSGIGRRSLQFHYQPKGGNELTICQLKDSKGREEERPCAPTHPSAIVDQVGESSGYMSMRVKNRPPCDTGASHICVGLAPKTDTTSPPRAW